MQELSEFQKSMVPLAREAVLTGISYREVADNLMYTLIVVAVEESQGNQTVAARRLGLSSPYVSGVLAGKSLVKARRAKHPVKAT